MQSLIIINDESYAATAWQATLLIFASVIGMGLFNIFGVKHLPLAEGIFVVSHFFAFFPIIIVILVLAPKDNSEGSLLELQRQWSQLADCRMDHSSWSGQRHVQCTG